MYLCFLVIVLLFSPRSIQIPVNVNSFMCQRLYQYDKHRVQFANETSLAPLDDAQSLAKYDLARALAIDAPDMRVFDDPLSYFTCPEQP